MIDNNWVIDKAFNLKI